VGRLNSSLASGSEELLDPTMPEALDHLYSVALHVSLVEQQRMSATIPALGSGLTLIAGLGFPVSTLQASQSPQPPENIPQIVLPKFADYFQEIAKLKTIGACAMLESPELASDESACDAPDQLIAKATEGKIIN
jgi:hypothetical protein